MPEEKRRKWGQKAKDESLSPACSVQYVSVPESGSLGQSWAWWARWLFGGFLAGAAENLANGSMPLSDDLIMASVGRHISYLSLEQSNILCLWLFTFDYCPSCRPRIRHEQISNTCDQWPLPDNEKVRKAHVWPPQVGFKYWGT